MPTLFLDRDGVVNKNQPGYITSWSDFHFLDGAQEAIAQLTDAGYQIFICTNQAGIAKGLVSRKTVEEIHYHMITEITHYGGKIEKVYYCPHIQEDHCFCRKPQPGMLIRAYQEYALDMSNAFLIGDALSDIQAGLVVGVQTILVLTGRGKEQLQAYEYQGKRPFLVAKNLLHAAEMVLNHQPDCQEAEETVGLIREEQ